MNRAAPVPIGWGGHSNGENRRTLASVEQGSLGHVVRRKDLEEEFRRRRRHFDDLLRSGVSDYLQQELVMDPSQVQDAHPGSYGAATELVPAGQAASARFGRALRSAVR